MDSIFIEDAMQYLDGLYGYAMTLTRNPAEAEDLVQETYLQARGTSERLRPGSHLKTWLFRIQRHVWLNRLRDHRSGPQAPDAHEEPHDPTHALDTPCDPFSSYLSRLQHSEIRDAIERLPAHHREVIVLREFEELSYQEMAAVLDCTTWKVISRLRRARDDLRQLLQHGNPGSNSSTKGASEF